MDGWIIVVSVYIKLRCKLSPSMPIHYCSADSSDSLGTKTLFQIGTEFKIQSIENLQQKQNTVSTYPFWNMEPMLCMSFVLIWARMQSYITVPWHTNLFGNKVKADQMVNCGLSQSGKTICVERTILSQLSNLCHLGIIKTFVENHDYGKVL